MKRKTTFKGEEITLPEMPEPFFWRVNDQHDIDLRRNDETFHDVLESWAGNFSGMRIVACVSRAGSSLSAPYRMPTWQAALDYLAARALLGGIDDNERGDI